MHGRDIFTVLGRENTENKNRSDLGSRWLLIATVALLGVVIYAGNVMTVNTSKLTDIICLGAFTVLPISGIVCAICFLIPLHSGITGLYIYGFAIVMILLKSKTFKVKMLIPFAVIVLYEIIMMVFAGTDQINHVVVYALALFLLLYMMNADDLDPKAACICYVCGTVVLLICIFTTALQNYSLEMVLSGAVRIGEYEGQEDIGKVAVVTENANAMAYYALVAILIAFNMMKNVKTLGKILLGAAMVILTVIALFTVSRTFVLVLILFMLLSIMTGNGFKQKIGILLAVGVVLVIAVPYLMTKTQIFDAFSARFEDDSMITGTGRVDIFIEYMRYLGEHPLRLIFGTGSVFYKDVCQLEHSMHNGTQQILVSYGLVGFFPMIVVLLSPIFEYFHKNKFKLIKIIPLLAAVVFVQSIQFLNPNNLMLPFAVAVLCMKIPDKEIKQ